VDQILAEEAVNGGADETVQWTLTDHLNTVRDIAKYDSQTGVTTVVNHLVYDAFGRVTSETNPAVDSLFLFTARPFDQDTGLQNNLNRWYDASVGRWLSEDPVVFGGGVNLYAYSGNSPATVPDPSGEAPAEWEPVRYYSLGVGALHPVIKGKWWGFSALINWIVEPRPIMPPKHTGLPSTSWIIQYVTAEFDVRDARGDRIHDPRDDGRWGYWEAWEVRPGQPSPVTRPGVAIDDIFSQPNGLPDTCGTIVMTGFAAFYPYTNLPPDFVSHNPMTHARDLRSTRNANALVGLQPRSATFVRIVRATWSTERPTTHVVQMLFPGELPEPWPGNIA